MKNSLLGALLFGMVVACGGDSGPSDSTKVTDLTEDEAHELCDELADSFPEREVTCGDVTITFGINHEECDSDVDSIPPACQATAGDLRDCFAALGALSDAQVCDDTPLPAACAPINTPECDG
ncbi:MAG: hypothetical protein R2939_01235 [Kofleriaceae bacterium]